MATVRVDAGVCGHSAVIKAIRGDGHTACPVPSALVKAVEVAAGLALPRDVGMQISAE